MAVYQNKNNSTKDGRNWYFSTYYNTIDGTRKKYKSKKFLTKKEAMEQERIFLLNITSKINYSSLTFKDLINSFLEYQKDKVKITSYSNYNKCVKKLEEFYSVKICDFSIEKFNQWKSKINNFNYSTRYKNNIYKFLITLLNFASRFYDYDWNKIKLKISGFNNPNELKKEMLFYTYDEFIKFINQEDDIKYKCYFEILYYCGLRKGEANALTWKDVDFQNKTVIINKNLTQKIAGEKYIILPPKTKSSNRTLPLPNCLIKDIKMLYNDFKKYKNFDNNWFIFGGQFPLADSTTHKRKNINADKANIKKIRLHDFRHSCASLLISNGASVGLVAKYLGHSNITTTLNTYTHMFKNEMSDIIKIINNLEN